MNINEAYERQDIVYILEEKRQRRALGTEERKECGPRKVSEASFDPSLERMQK
jgi:hypothetical protein